MVDHELEQIKLSQFAPQVLADPTQAKELRNLLVGHMATINTVFKYYCGFSEGDVQPSGEVFGGDTGTMSHLEFRHFIGQLKLFENDEICYKILTVSSSTHPNYKKRWIRTLSIRTWYALLILLRTSGYPQGVFIMCNEEEGSGDEDNPGGQPE